MYRQRGIPTHDRLPGKQPLNLKIWRHQERNASLITRCRMTQKPRLLPPEKKNSATAALEATLKLQSVKTANKEKRRQTRAEWSEFGRRGHLPIHNRIARPIIDLITRDRLRFHFAARRLQREKNFRQRGLRLRLVASRSAPASFAEPVSLRLAYPRWVPTQTCLGNQIYLHMYVPISRDAISGPPGAGE